MTTGNSTSPHESSSSQPSSQQATIAAGSAEPVRMTGSQAIVRSLELLGVTDIFGLPGGAILPTYDPLFD